MVEENDMAWINQCNVGIQTDLLLLLSVVSFCWWLEKSFQKKRKGAHDLK